MFEIVYNLLGATPGWANLVPRRRFLILPPIILILAYSRLDHLSRRHLHLQLKQQRHNNCRSQCCVRSFARHDLCCRYGCFESFFAQNSLVDIVQGLQFDPAKNEEDREKAVAECVKMFKKLLFKRSLSRTGRKEMQELHI
ncbi:hypothetical protein M3Y97_00579300 [Aphelenchoides bicaudatus]|nr:hypothetical protein M3Y97_00579300 [Aphelenchoides bicaudatus]